MSISARGCSLQEILSNRRHYKVADYQRRYEWSLAQMRRLLEDLLGSFRRATAHEQTPHHFVGSFILQKARDKEHIVDGQQRLTSISIIAAVARDLVADAALQQEFDSFITDRARLRGAPPLKRIEHHRGDEDVYDTLVVVPGATRNAHAAQLDDELAEIMRRNVLVTLSYLSKLSTDELRLFVAHIMEQCRAIEIKLEGDEDPFHIFSSVNGRGQPVRQQDIIRVTLLEKATPDRAIRTRLLRKWDRAERLLGADGFERYLLLRRCAATGKLETSREFLDAMHTDFLGPDEINQFIAIDMEIECEAYLAVVECDVRWRHDRRKFPIKNVLYALSLASFDEWRPLAVAILVRYRGNAAEALLWLRKLEALVWYWFLDSGGKYDAVDRIERFHSVAKYFKHKSDWVVSDSNIELRKDEKARIAEFLNGRLEEDLPELRSLLLRLEQALRRGQPPRHIRGDFTIEHVLPRSGGGAEWAKYLGMTAEAEIKDLARRLGNMCFVPRPLNRELGEKLFEEKKSLAVGARASRDSFLARDLCTAKDWKPSTINARTEKLVRVFAEALDLG